MLLSHTCRIMASFLLKGSCRIGQHVVYQQIRMNFEGEPRFAFGGWLRRAAAIVLTITVSKEVGKSVCFVRIVQEWILEFWILVEINIIVIVSVLMRLGASRSPPIIGLCGNFYDRDGHKERCRAIVVSASDVGDFDLLICRLHIDRMTRRALCFVCCVVAPSREREHVCRCS